MTRGLKVIILSYCSHKGSKGYTDWPDDKGTESFYLPHTSSHIQAGYTDWPDDKGTERVKDDFWEMAILVSVTLIDPMTRGLKEKFWRTFKKSENRCYTDWPDDKGTESMIILPLSTTTIPQLHWLTRWQGDWKTIKKAKNTALKSCRYTDWPDDKGTERLSFDNSRFRIFSLHWLTRWQGDWKPFRDSFLGLFLLTLHWLTRWQGDWKRKRGAFFCAHFCSYTDWPDDKGTERP